jgi:hypothetical protein
MHKTSRKPILAVATAFIFAASPATADDALLKNVPPETLKLYQRYLAEYKTPNNSDPKLVTDLEAAPGGDLCFLDRALQPNGDWPQITARSEVEKLKTPAIYAALIPQLDSDERTRRANAITILATYHDAKLLPKFLDILQKDSSEFPRDAAVQALANFDEPGVEDALLATINDPVPMIAAHAYGSLGGLKSKRAFPLIVAQLHKSQNDVREGFISTVASYHNKEAVGVLLEEFQIHAAKTDEWSQRLREWTHFRLRDCLSEARPILGPWPDQRLDEWQDFWARAQPLLNDNLALKEKPQAKPAPIFRPEDFARTAADIKLTASLGAAEFRTGDPIRLTLTLANDGKLPASVILPGPPNGWMPTMAYGIRLKRGEEVLMDLPPSDFYLGSYSGPPAFTTLAPGGNFHSQICLQYWLERLFDLPLKEGDYELSIVFDPSKFAGMRPPTGVQLLTRMEVPPVKFTIIGEPRKEPAEVLAAIAQLAEHKFLFPDLTSENPERHDPAWSLVREYGDSRLAPFLKEIETAQPARKPTFFGSDSLRPFESKARTPQQ